MTSLDYIRCPKCNTILAARVADLTVIKFRGREFVCVDVLSIKCECCGGVWKPSEAANDCAKVAA